MTHCHTSTYFFCKFFYLCFSFFFVSSGWEAKGDDIPDAWIPPKHSVIMEIKGGEIVPCVGEKFLTRVCDNLFTPLEVKNDDNFKSL